MKVLLMHQTMAAHDAIGADISYMETLFGGKTARTEGVYVYCEFPGKAGCAYVNRKQALEIAKNPRNLVIYHHSGFWEDGGALLQEAGSPMARLVIRYHNVTPPEFFADYSAFYFQNCTRGRRQTETLEEVFPQAWWLCDSAYNASELELVPAERKKILHPFHNLAAWESVVPDKETLEALQAQPEQKILFTGRVVPNKGHLDLLSVIEDYRANYGDAIVLYSIGKFDGSVDFYTEEVRRRILAAGLEKQVHFVGEVTDEKLLAYYKGCDCYVSLSRHEGFGVPFIEAQALGIPVIARDAGAAGEVLGKGGLLFGQELSHYSAAIAYLKDHPEVAQALVEEGHRNCGRYRNEPAGEALLDWIENVMQEEEPWDDSEKNCRKR